MKQPLFQIGMTFVELLIVTSVLTMVSIIAVPTFTKTMQNWEAKKFKNTITSGFRQAKLNSYTNHQDVILCTVNRLEACDRAATSALLIFIDKNGNKRFDKSTDIIISKTSFDLKYGRLYLAAGARRDYIKFFGNSGLPIGHMAHIKYCPNETDNTNMFKISINMQGGVKFKPHAYDDTNCPNS